MSGHLKSVLRGSQARCAYCRDDIHPRQTPVECLDCGLLAHVDCHDDMGQGRHRCPNLGCSGWLCGAEGPIERAATCAPLDSLGMPAPLQLTAERTSYATRGELWGVPGTLAPIGLEGLSAAVVATVGLVPVLVLLTGLQPQSALLIVLVLAAGGWAGWRWTTPRPCAVCQTPTRGLRGVCRYHSGWGGGSSGTPV